MSWTHHYEVGDTLRPLYEAEARERMTAGINQYSSPPEKIPEGSNGDARDKAGEARERQLAQLKQNQDTVREKIPQRENGDSRDQAGEAEARERQITLAGTRPNVSGDLPVKIPEGTNGKARDYAATLEDAGIARHLSPWSGR